MNCKNDAGKLAAEVFKREYTNVLNTEHGQTLFNYENHYSARLNKCSTCEAVHGGLAASVELSQQPLCFLLRQPTSDHRLRYSLLCFHHHQPGRRYGRR
jgi:hypothetical protein